MDKIYTTMEGDTLDMIALDVYNSEYLSFQIAGANPQYAHVLVFPAGVRLRIPPAPARSPETLPPWRRI